VPITYKSEAEELVSDNSVKHQALHTGV